MKKLMMSAMMNGEKKMRRRLSRIGARLFFLQDFNGSEVDMKLDLRARIRATVAMLVMVGVVVTVPGPAVADPVGARVPDQEDSTPPMAPAQVVAHSIGELGRTRYRDIFAGLEVDADTGQVVLYVTQPAQAQELVSQGFTRVPTTARSATSVEVRISKYARPQMEITSAHIWKLAEDWESVGVNVYMIALPSDGSGLEVRTNDPAQASTLMTTVSAPEAGVSVADIDFILGNPVQALSRENPDPPYEGGIPIRLDWRQGYNCTAAFGVYVPIVEKEYLVTAEHCYDYGDGVEDMEGDNIGTVRTKSLLYDAATIETDADSGVWVDDDHMFNFRSSQYSYKGEYVCQSGYTSHDRCWIQVIHFVQWKDNTGTVRQGVEGRACAGCPAVAHGDSGGPVWTIRAAEGGVASRGIVSAGHTPVEPDVSYENILWTETPDVLGALGVELLTP